MTDISLGHSGRLRVLVAMTVLCALMVGERPVGAQTDAAGSRAPELSVQLDDVLAFAPPETCFTLSVGGRTVYRHNGDLDLMPASNQKLVTAAAALHVLGADHVYRTRLLAAEEPSGGVIDGDIALVGGGDPLLVTDLFRLIDGMGDDQHPTRFEDLAEQVVASGVTRITGRVIGDESRYDAVRTVSSWPDRYVAQRQSGPLSALSLDDGYRIAVPPPDSDRAPVWHRSEDPAAHAARALHDHLVVRGVEIGGEPISGSAGARQVEVTGLDSAGLTDVLSQLLVESDNQTGELMLKEIGRELGGGGSTEAGIAAVNETLDQMGLTPGDVTVTDGSGLDRGNRISCDDLVALLDASGGPGGVIGQALPVAGTNGTLRGRFADSQLAGQLRAKTGRLSDVTSLAGFTPMLGDEVATFAYISNGEVVTADLLGLQEHVLNVVSLHHPPCEGEGPPPMPVPVGPLAAQASLLGMPAGPLAMAPAAALPLPVMGEHPALAVPA